MYTHIHSYTHMYTHIPAPSLDCIDADDGAQNLQGEGQRGRGQGHQRRRLSNSIPSTCTALTSRLLLLAPLHPIGVIISLPSSLSTSHPVTHYLLCLGHPTPSKSTTTVAIVTRGRGACCHRISPGPSHPAGTTDCSYCCITELLGLHVQVRGVRGEE